MTTDTNTNTKMAHLKANILITHDGTLKLYKFSAAIQITDDEDNKIDYETPPSSAPCMAPEIIGMNGEWTTAIDIWSLGATAIQLFTGHLPYRNLQPMSALFRITQDPHPGLPENASDTFKDFLLECCNKDPSLRPNASALLSHEWFIHTLWTLTNQHKEQINTVLNQFHLECVAEIIVQYLSDNKETRIE